MAIVVGSFGVAAGFLAPSAEFWIASLLVFGLSLFLGSVVVGVAALTIITLIALILLAVRRDVPSRHQRSPRFLDGVWNIAIALAGFVIFLTIAPDQLEAFEPVGVSYEVAYVLMGAGTATLIWLRKRAGVHLRTPQPVQGSLRSRVVGRVLRRLSSRDGEQLVMPEVRASMSDEQSMHAATGVEIATSESVKIKLPRLPDDQPLHVGEVFVVKEDGRLEATRVTEGTLEVPANSELLLDPTALGSLGDPLRGIDPNVFTAVAITGFGVNDMTDDDLIALRHLTGLRRFDAGHMSRGEVGHARQRITDRGMAAVAAFGRLREFHLGSDHVSDAGIGFLSGLTELEAVWLNCPLVTYRGLAKLRIHHLKRLTYAYPRTPLGTDLGFLAPARSLKELRLQWAGVDEEGLRILAKLPDLQILDLIGNRRFDSERTPNGRVGDKALSRIRKLRNLEQLVLSRTEITDWGIALLSQLRRLRTLDLSHTSISNHAAPDLAAMTSVTDLDVSGTGIGDEGLVELLEGLRLKRLSLAHTRISEVVLPFITAADTIEDLDLSGVSINPGELRQLAVLPNLRVLHVTHLQDGPDGVGEDLQAALPRVQVLHWYL